MIDILDIIQRHRLWLSICLGVSIVISLIIGIPDMGLPLKVFLGGFGLAIWILFISMIVVYEWGQRHPDNELNVYHHDIVPSGRVISNEQYIPPERRVYY